MHGHKKQKTRPFRDEPPAAEPYDLAPLGKEAVRLSYVLSSLVEDTTNDIPQNDDSVAEVHGVFQNMEYEHHERWCSMRLQQLCHQAEHKSSGRNQND